MKNKKGIKKLMADIFIALIIYIIMRIVVITTDQLIIDFTLLLALLYCVLIIHDILDDIMSNTKKKVDTVRCIQCGEPLGVYSPMLFTCNPCKISFRLESVNNNTGLTRLLFYSKDKELKKNEYT